MSRRVVESFVVLSGLWLSGILKQRKLDCIRQQKSRAVSLRCVHVWILFRSGTQLAAEVQPEKGSLDTLQDLNVDYPTPHPQISLVPASPEPTSLEAYLTLKQEFLRSTPPERMRCLLRGPIEARFRGVISLGGRFTAAKPVRAVHSARFALVDASFP